MFPCAEEICHKMVIEEAKDKRGIKDNLRKDEVDPKSCMSIVLNRADKKGAWKEDGQ